MSRPRLLDLFCGAGGAAVGYHRAGFDVVGVDIKPQPHYPFEFIQADAMLMLSSAAAKRASVSPEHPKGLGVSSILLGNFSAIHASPPCQDHMRTPHPTHGTGWMLPKTRELLSVIGLPWVIENVASAPMRADYVLCGCMFGLRTSSGLGLRRERWFETSWHGYSLMTQHDHGEPAISVVGHGTPSWVRSKLGRNPTIAEYREAMGIDWMNRNELSQAIPPAYTEWIGRQLLAALENAA